MEFKKKLQKLELDNNGMMDYQNNFEIYLVN